MEVILAKTAGFCFGVKRAVDTVYKEAGKKNVYTYGPIIHNSEVVNDLKKKGDGSDQFQRRIRSFGRRNGYHTFPWSCERNL